MHLHDSPSSPFVRKVDVVIHELGLGDRVGRSLTSAHPVTRDPALVLLNPLGQVPTLVLESGEVLADSRVICEYLDDLADGGLFPPPGRSRWQALARQSAADGAMAAAILLRYETGLRAPAQRSEAWIAGQTGKIVSVLDGLETGGPDPFDIGAIASACLLGYLDFRFPDLGWRGGRPRLEAWYGGVSRRASLLATRPRPKLSDAPDDQGAGR